MEKETPKPKTIHRALAAAILRRLWCDGLITEEEKKRIEARNARSFKK